MIPKSNGQPNRPYRSREGIELQRAPLYLPPPVWDVLFALSNAAACNPHALIESLILSAAATRLAAPTAALPLHHSQR